VRHSLVWKTKYGKGGRKRIESSWRNTLKYQAKKLPKLRRGNDTQRRQGARRKKKNGGRRRRSGLERSRSVDT